MDVNFKDRMGSRTGSAVGKDGEHLAIVNVDLELKDSLQGGNIPIGTHETKVTNSDALNSLTRFFHRRPNLHLQ